MKHSNYIMEHDSKKVLQQPCTSYFVDISSCSLPFMFVVFCAFKTNVVRKCALPRNVTFLRRWCCLSA